MAPNFPSLWRLDPKVTFLNHGSFGACPAAVLDVQSELRAEMEREPVDFLAVTLPARLDAAREEFAPFLNADARDLVFVPNATTGVNAVLRSLDFAAGDEILLTNHTYAACRKTVDYLAGRAGARPVVAQLPVPLKSGDEIIAPILERVTARTRIALLDHVTSPTALVMPVGRLVAELRARGVESVIDGAHAPGMVPLDLRALGAAYYTGNAHKWLCAPKGAAFLHVRRDRHVGLHPLVISHGYPNGLRAEFDWTGTSDPTPWLCIPEVVRYMRGLVPGGWPEIMARNRALTLEARGLLLERFGIDAPCPESMIGSIASIPLPAAASGSPAARLASVGLCAGFRERGVRTWTYEDPVRLLRVSAQLYNDIEQYRTLAGLLEEALRGG